MENKVTLKQIAELAGISINSVSKALKNSPSISKAMKEKVNRIANELGYFPNVHAQNLRGGPSNVIALVYDNITNPYYQIMTEVVNNEITDHGYELMIFVDNNSQGHLSEKTVKRILPYGVRGILTFIAPTSEASTIIKKSNLPTVLIGRDGQLTNTESIYTNDVMGGDIAARELINQGGKVFAYATKHAGLKIDELRLQGFKKGLKTGGYTLKKNNILVADLEIRLPTLIKDAMKSEKIDSIFCFSDIIAFEVVSILYDLGYKVPEDVNVVGFDNLQEYFPYPLRLSSISNDKEAMIKKALEMLLTQDIDSPRYIKMPVQYIPGNSTMKK